MPSAHPPWTLWHTADARDCIRVPTAQDHKYTRGVLGMVTGSGPYPGAAVLTTAGALATGVGMVRFQAATAHPSLARLVLQRSPEVVVAPGRVHAWLLGSGVAPPGAWSPANWLRQRQMASAAAQAAPIVLDDGLRAAPIVLDGGLRAAPIVLDAGALHLAGRLRAPTLITPHAGELAALLNARDVTVSHQAIAADSQHWARLAQQTLGVTVLLKGANTVVAGEGVCILLAPSTPWLATAGTGDVLAGIVGALVATWHVEVAARPALLAQLAATGAFIHARAAALASGGGPLTASALLDAIGPVVRELLGAGPPGFSALP